MFTIDRSMNAEIEYRQQRVAQGFTTGRKGIKALRRPGRRLSAGSRPGLTGVRGNVATAA